MIHVFWKAVELLPLPAGGWRIQPLPMSWTSYPAACLEAFRHGPHAMLVRLPGDPNGPIPQPTELPLPHG